jgi:hypothetical protein
MTDISEEKLSKFFAKAFNEVVIPALEDMEGRLASKNDLTEVNKDIGGRIDTLDRKFDAQQDRLDRHAKIQENLDKRVGVLEVSVGN